MGDDARRDLREARRLLDAGRPADALALLERLAGDPWADLARGDALQAVGRAADAVAAYEAVVAAYRRRAAQDAGGWNAAFGLQAPAALALAARGDALLSLGRTADALGSYDAAQAFARAWEEQLGEEDWAARGAAADALLRKADALAGLGDRDGAAACLRAVIARASGGPAAVGLGEWAERARRRLAELELGLEGE